MIRVSVLYPRSPGATFDFEYYLNRHMPLSVRLLGDRITRVTIERGIEGQEAGSPSPFFALCHFTCASRAEFEAAFLPHAAELAGDITNYTNAQPSFQFSELIELK